VNKAEAITQFALAVRDHALTKCASRMVRWTGTALTAVAILLVLYRVVPPAASGVFWFLLAHWVWTSVGVATLVLIGIVLADAGGGCSCGMLPGYVSEQDLCDRVLRPCWGSAYGSAYLASDCVRIDPYGRCFRIEPCLAVSTGDTFVDPFPKRPPCRDILSPDGRIVPALQYKPCVIVDFVSDCYRPTDC